MCMTLIVIAASYLRGDVLGKELQPVYLTAEQCVSASPKKLMLACLGAMLPIRCFSRIAPRLFLARSSRVLLVCSTWRPCLACRAVVRCKALFY